MKESEKKELRKIGEEFLKKLRAAPYNNDKVGQSFIKKTSSKPKTVKDTSNLKPGGKFYELFKDVPYLWGGRSSFGYDCSGFIQTLISFFDINFPRDAKDQVNYSKMFKINDNYKKGDLIFFKDGQNIAHVAVLINEKDYMHSSGKIKINSLSSSSNFFDEQLYNNIYGVYRYKS